MSRTLHLFGTDWCAMMVPIQVIRWYRMQCYDGTDSCATVVPIRRYCQQTNNGMIYPISMNPKQRLQILRSMDVYNIRIKISLDFLAISNKHFICLRFGKWQNIISDTRSMNYLKRTNERRPCYYCKFNTFIFSQFSCHTNNPSTSTLQFRLST